jgi:hypothetical protein
MSVRRKHRRHRHLDHWSDEHLHHLPRMPKIRADIDRIRAEMLGQS